MGGATAPCDRRMVAAAMSGMWRRAIGYGVLLAAGTFALQWLDYRRLAFDHSEDITMFLIATGFLALGVYVGVRVVAKSRPIPFDGNPQALAALGISPRELAVLQALAEGKSNKEIAKALDVSPNTVKTHIARLFEKLEAKRRTEAIRKARSLGLVR